MKTIAVMLVALFLLTSCATGQITASSDCVQALAALGISIAEGASTGGTFDLSSVLALILSNGGDISGAVAACSALFTAKTQQDLKSVVATKVDSIKTTSPSARAASGQKIPVPAAPIKVRIR